MQKKSKRSQRKQTKSRDGSHRKNRDGVSKYLEQAKRAYDIADEWTEEAEAYNKLTDERNKVNADFVANDPGGCFVALFDCDANVLDSIEATIEKIEKAKMSEYSKEVYKYLEDKKKKLEAVLEIWPSIADDCEEAKDTKLKSIKGKVEENDAATA